MKNINLKDIYSTLYDRDCFCGVSNRINRYFIKCRRKEKAWKQRQRRYKAYYSLDRDDGIENDCLYPPALTDETYERKEELRVLYHAFQTLTMKQQKRIYQYFFMEMGYTDIAKLEGVDESTIRESTEAALSRLKKYFTFFS